MYVPPVSALTRKLFQLWHHIASEADHSSKIWQRYEILDVKRFCCKVLDLLQWILKVQKEVCQVAKRSPICKTGFIHRGRCIWLVDRQSAALYNGSWLAVNPTWTWCLHNALVCPQNDLAPKASIICWYLLALAWDSTHEIVYGEPNLHVCTRLASTVMVMEQGSSVLMRIANCTWYILQRAIGISILSNPQVLLMLSPLSVRSCLQKSRPIVLRLLFWRLQGPSTSQSHFVYDIQSQSVSRLQKLYPMSMCTATYTFQAHGIYWTHQITVWACTEVLMIR